MELKFYLNKSPHNKINKDLELIATLVDGSIASWDEFNFRQKSELKVARRDFSNINYFEFNGNFYFIGGINHLSNDLTSVTGELDVVSTYADYIMNLRGLVEEGVGADNDVVDNRDLMRISKSIEVIEGDSLSGPAASLPDYNEWDDEAYILVTATSPHKSEG